MKLCTIEMRVEKLKAKVRGFLRTRLNRVLEKLTDPTIDRRQFLNVLVEMVLQHKAKVNDVLRVEGSKGDIPEHLRKSVQEFLISEDWKKPSEVPTPPRGGMLVGYAVPHPDRDPPLKGSKAAAQQKFHMRHRNCSKGSYSRCSICNPNKLSPETMAALKKWLRLK